MKRFLKLIGKKRNKVKDLRELKSSIRLFEESKEEIERWTKLYEELLKSTNNK